MSQHRNVKTAVYIIAFVALADQLSKWWLVNGLKLAQGETKPVMPFLNLVDVRNKGVTFGLLNNIDRDFMPYILAAVAAVILFLLGRWLWLTSSRFVSIGLACVIGGAIGNVLDRVREGAVVDFLDFYYQDHHWYAFNIADAAIVTGVGLLLIDSLVRAR